LYWLPGEKVVRHLFKDIVCRRDLAQDLLFILQNQSARQMLVFLFEQLQVMTETSSHIHQQSFVCAFLHSTTQTFFHRVEAGVYPRRFPGSVSAHVVVEARR